MWDSKCVEHKDMKIMMVCLEEKCQDNRLCCITCIDEFHCRHQVISLRKLTSLMAEKLQHNNQNQQKGKIYKLIQQCQEWMMKKLKVIENTFMHQLQKCEEEITKYFVDLHCAFSLPEHTIILKKLSKSFTNEAVNEVLQNMKLCQKHKFGTAKETQSMIEFQKSIFLQKVYKIKDEIKEKTKTLFEGLDKMRIASRKNHQPVFFHKIHKSHLLNIEDSSTIVSKQNTQGGRPLQLVNRPIDPANNRISFKILRNGSGVKSICLGFCFLPFVRSSNFTNCLGFKKGTYGIDQASFSGWGIQQSEVAMSFNHHSQLHHNKAVDFQIDEGDIVKMEINFDTMQMLIEKEDDEDELIMPIDLLECRDIYPFVSLTNNDSAVEIYN